MSDLILSSGVAIILYTNLNGFENLEWMHPHYRSIVKKLPYYPEFESPMILNLLHRYAMTYLISAEGNTDDLELLKTALDKIYRTQNPSLYGEMVKLLIRLNDVERLKRAVKGCFRFLGSLSEVKYSFLCYISIILKKIPGALSHKYYRFFSYQLEK